MYVKKSIERLTQIIKNYDGIADKKKLSIIVQKEFGLIQDRKVFSGDDFSIRFSKSEKKKMSNTVLSLSSLQKYDNKPFIVCIVSSTINYMLLANTTFLKKISHSSQELRIDNIKGSFNGSDIMDEIDGIKNSPEYFEDLFAIHSGFSFQDNLERLVENTNGIVSRVQKFCISDNNKTIIFNSINRAQKFVTSSEYSDLKNDLDNRVANVQNEIAIAALIDNVNLRGRVIEYLITNNGSVLKDQIIRSLNEKTPLPNFKTNDKLGDYTKNYQDFYTEADIKTKVLFLQGNPKAYNIDKLLEFLATEKSVYLIYLIGISDKGKIVSRLCSVFDTRLIDATNIIHHWAGRNSRGVTQFLGTKLSKILSENNTSSIIDIKKSMCFIQSLIEQ